MKGQRSDAKAIRSMLALLLCAVFLLVLIAPVVAAVEDVQETPESGPVVRAATYLGGDSTSDGGGSEDPSTDGDPDDYDKVRKPAHGELYWIMLVTSTLFRVI